MRVNVIRFTAIVLLLTTTCSRGARAEADDPVASFSKYDDIQSMIDAGFKFNHAELIIQRVTMGALGDDRTYQIRKHQFDELGLKWGAYHSARVESGSEGPIQQADHFIKAVYDFRPPSSGKVLLVVNWQRYGKDQRKWMTPKALAQLVERIHQKTGHYPGIATDVESLTALSEANASDPEAFAVLGNCWLWLRAWTKAEPTVPVRTPWKDWTFWLHDSVDNPDRQTLRDSSKITPDLSISRIPRGADLENWWQTNAWDCVLKSE